MTMPTTPLATCPPPAGMDAAARAALPRWCVLIPCLDEEAAIGAVVESVLALGAPVIVVDDGSSDRTPEILAALPVTLLRHARRCGKGQALREGFREALRQGFAAVLTMDGDGQHLASDIPRLLAAAATHPGQIVIGARLLDKAQQPKARRRANAVADWGISWGCAQPVADTQSGQRWYPRAALDLVDLPAQDFVFEAALLIAASRELGMGIVSVPIASRYHAGHRPSHLRPVRDVTRITVYTILRVLHYGHVVRAYRRGQGAPRIVDPPPLELNPPGAARSRGS
jgi:glycosyltransferase involved in cell wall biosynthesis